MKNTQILPSLVALTALIMLASNAWRDGWFSADGGWARGALHSALVHPPSEA